MSFDFSSFFTISGIVFCESTYKQVEKDDLPFWVSCHNSINSSSFKAIYLLFPNETPQRKHVAKRNGIMVYLSSVPGIVRKPPPKLANEPPNHYEAGFWPPTGKQLHAGILSYDVLVGVKMQHGAYFTTYIGNSNSKRIYETFCVW